MLIVGDSQASRLPKMDNATLLCKSGHTVESILMCVPHDLEHVTSLILMWGTAHLLKGKSVASAMEGTRVLLGRLSPMCKVFVVGVPVLEKHHEDSKELNRFFGLQKCFFFRVGRSHLDRDNVHISSNCGVNIKQFIINKL
jgi:hypothetical protein